jgi:PAS domain S-box-containing protein
VLPTSNHAKEYDVSLPIDVAAFAETLVQQAPDAIVFADAEGLVRFWNRGAERVFGFDEAEALAQSLDLIIPGPLRKRHWDGHAQTMRTGKTRYGSGDILAVPAIREDGVRVAVEFTIIPFRDDAGRMLGTAAILRVLPGDLSR